MDGLVHLTNTGTIRSLNAFSQPADGSAFSEGMSVGGGTIVNVSSRGAFRGEPEHPAYGASKAGLIAFGQSLARALGPHEIIVSAVAPGFVETDMAAAELVGEQGAARRAESPLGRVCTPDEIAAAVVFLASPEAKMASGSVLDVNGASYLRM